MPAFEFYVLFAMFYRGRMDWTLPTCVTRRRHSSCCTAIKVIVMYWCLLTLWYWYWLFVYDSWAVSALLSVTKIISYLLTYLLHLLSRARFLSLAWSKLRLCSANHRPGYWSNLPCDWPSTAWAYSEQETENGPRRLLSENSADIYNNTWLRRTFPWWCT